MLHFWQAMKSEPTDVNTQRMPFAMLTKEDLLVRSFSDEILKITKFLKIDELDKFETERYTQYDWFFTGKNFLGSFWSHCSTMTELSLNCWDRLYC